MPSLRTTLKTAFLSFAQRAKTASSSRQQGARGRPSCQLTPHPCPCATPTKSTSVTSNSNSGWQRTLRGALTPLLYKLHHVLIMRKLQLARGLTPASSAWPVPVRSALRCAHVKHMGCSCDRGLSRTTAFLPNGRNTWADLEPHCRHFEGRRSMQGGGGAQLAAEPPFVASNPMATVHPTVRRLFLGLAPCWFAHRQQRTCRSRRIHCTKSTTPGFILIAFLAAPP